MALQSQLWSPATSMPMAESSLYRQRLEVIAEKRRLQEEIRAVHRELEEEKLRVERLKRKSLRERWLMDGAAAGPESPEDPDFQSPKGQAQAHIQNLEDSLFTLQSQLQLLQSASTGAQHKPSGKPTWRRQGHRPLSLPTVETGATGQTDLDKRASLPAGPIGEPPDTPSEATGEAVGGPWGPRRVPGVEGTSSEANGPCPKASPLREPDPSQGAAVAEGGLGEAKEGGVVRVVWEGLRATEDCTLGVTGPELEAKVEEMVLEAIRERQGTSSPEQPSWVRKDSSMVEVIWEGVGGPEGSEAEALEEAGRGPEVAQMHPLRLPGRLVGAASTEGEGAPGDSPESGVQGGSGGEEGSFIWVERVTLSEDWEELQVEGLEGSRVVGTEGGDESRLGTDRGGGEESWEVERRRAEESLGMEEKGSEDQLWTEREGVESSGVEKKGGEGQLGTEREGLELSGVEKKGGEDQLGTEREGVEPLEVEKKGDEDQLGVEREGLELSGVEKKGGEDQLGVEREGLELSGVEKKGDEDQLETEREGLESSGVEKKGGEGLLGTEMDGAEEPIGSENKEGEALLKVERKGGEETLEAEETQVQGAISPGEQRESEEEEEAAAEEASKAGASPRVQKQPSPVEGELPPAEKQEASPEGEAAKPPTPTEGQRPAGDTARLLAGPQARKQPAECQPLLQVEEPSANPRARPTPTYAPARQPEPPAPAGGGEASGPKQKTCQCCAVM
ncbi:paralemmin-3 [Tamandua tetradactyla]|uniref:paralemmin-3 n=1 Tax=Tamandua tetradactyla TaxID=48850 RepID=UPI0040547C0C